MFMMTALSGTTNERNTAISNRKEAPSTATKNTAVRDFRKSLTSALTATSPVITGSRSVPAVAAGITVLRRCLTRASVSAA